MHLFHNLNFKFVREGLIISRDSSYGKNTLCNSTCNGLMKYCILLLYLIPIFICCNGQGLLMLKWCRTAILIQIFVCILPSKIGITPEYPKHLTIRVRIRISVRIRIRNRFKIRVRIRIRVRD